MEGRILNFRLSKHNKNRNQVIIEVEEINNRKDAFRLVGKKIILEIGNRRKIGKIVRPHGNKGRVLAKFRSGLSGNSLMKKVIIED